MSHIRRCSFLISNSETYLHEENKLTRTAMAEGPFRLLSRKRRLMARIGTEIPSAQRSDRLSSSNDIREYDIASDVCRYVKSVLDTRSVLCEYLNSYVDVCSLTSRGR